MYVRVCVCAYTVCIYMLARHLSWTVHVGEWGAHAVEPIGKLPI